INGTTFNKYVMTINASSGATTTHGLINVGGLQTGIGRAVVGPGTSSAAGYLELYAPSGSNIGYIGWETGRMYYHSTLTAGHQFNTRMAINPSSANTGMGMLEINSNVVNGTGGWTRNIHFNNSTGAITSSDLLLGLHSNKNFYFADINGTTLNKYVMSINATSGEIDTHNTIDVGGLQSGIGRAVVGPGTSSAAGYLGIYNQSNGYEGFIGWYTGRMFYQSNVGGHHFAVGSGATPTFSANAGHIAIKADTDNPYISWHLNSGGRMAWIQATGGTGADNALLAIGCGSFRVTALAGTGNRVLIADGSGNVTAQPYSTVGDNLGNHTATAGLNMNYNPITNASSVQASSSVGVGYSRIVTGTSSNAGYLEIYNPSSRVGYIGWETGLMYYHADAGYHRFSTHVSANGNVSAYTGGGYASLIPGNASNAGYLGIYNPSAGNVGYIGWETGDMYYHSTVGGHHFNDQIFIRGGGNSVFPTNAGHLALKSSGDNPYISFHAASGTRTAYIQSVGTGADAGTIHVGGGSFQVHTTGVRFSTFGGGGSAFAVLNNVGTLSRFELSGSMGSSGVFLRGDGVFTNTLNGSLTITGVFNSTGYKETSDIRWKKNVSNIPNALGKVMAMRGVNYDFKTKDELKKENLPTEYEFSDKKQIGFIAQEVERVLPEVVGIDEKGFKTVEYGKVVALLVEAMKEQQKQIEALQAENASLKAQVAKIKNLEAKLLALEEKWGEKPVSTPVKPATLGKTE
ncbi:MAG: tail fiber domain-containing protein, partial [Bacteroidia bacterium]|nr:tail fiber domain-containing protein [Bacteroidia bacterium]